MYKLINSNDINSQLLNQNVFIYGWIQKKIKVGHFLFITLRDSYGSCQLIFNKKKKPNFQYEELTNESFVSLKGTIKPKKNDLKNKAKNKKTNYEIHIIDLSILNKSSQLPFMIKNDTDGLEKLRLRYRYLDLRRPIMQKKMWTRHNIIKNIRLFFYEKQNFIELETPILAKPTIEGARNFLVQAFSTKNSFFALPQSPQIYKQTLMNSGFPAYFQIARCFRDEDLRNNRQPEFTQLDLEMNFANAEEVMKLTETLIIFLWKKFRPFYSEFKFSKLDYSVAWNKYGTDAPDLRYDLFLENYPKLLIDLDKKLIKEKVIKGIVFDKCLSSQEWIFLKTEIQKITNQELLFCFQKEKKNETNLNKKQVKILKPILNQNKKTNWIGFFEELKKVNLVLGKVRIILSNFFKLTINKVDTFCWVINQPMFEFSPSEKKYVTVHHPFCQPKDLSIFLKNWKHSLANAYDLVVNGNEIGSGSVRIHDWKIQNQVFQILGFDAKKIKTEFGFFIKSMQYGFPKHAGFALGLDRLVAIFTDSKSIRDVIPFPKTTKGTCLLTQNKN